MSESDKVVCQEFRCQWNGKGEEILCAPNPFVAGDTLYACPVCKAVGSIVVACDEPDCWGAATCGTPTKSGYRRTCWKHVPGVGE